MTKKTSTKLSRSAQAYQALCEKFARITTLTEIDAILAWDNAVVMPKKASHKRAQQVAVMKSMAHDVLCAEENEELFYQAREAYPKDSYHYHNLDLMERTWRVEKAIPAKLVEKIATLTVITEQKWRAVAQDATSSAAVLPSFTELVDACRERADIKAGVLGVSRYDATLDEFEPYAKASDIERLFSTVRQELPDLIYRYGRNKKSESSALRASALRGFSLCIGDQKILCEELACSVGFDFAGGRLDESAHPFSTGYRGDQRITVHYREHAPLDAIFALLHECGHALYEKNLPEEWQHLYIGNARGMALHESQSLFVENYIGKSDAYIAFLVQQIKKIHPDCPITNDIILQHCRAVSPGYIRVTADELTYPAHILIRFDIEKQLFAEEITTKDIEEVWNDKLQTYLQLPPSDKVKQTWMQDIHWFDGLFGYFPHYLVGNIIAAQLFAGYMQQTDKKQQTVLLQRGDTTHIQHWLEKHVHRHGSLVATDTIVKLASGESLSARPLINHFKQRFAD